jgi:hypothetical protein
MRADLQWRRSVDVVGAHQVDETPRPDGATLLGGEDAEDAELADPRGSTFFDLYGTDPEVGRHPV